ncbi:transglycosylase domain-containing protein [Hamadaea sp. NPDC050747]|uniref:transglycosylase domain-containing protein n=1 Tax=Hamadaea sp. NPDC050747 TaxID=3155789 RepID=UPI0033FF926D
MAAPARTSATPRKLVRAALVAVLAGAVVAGLAVPGSALAAWAVNHAGVAWDDLPEALQNPARQEASYLYASDGKTLLTTFYDQNRRDVSLDEVAPVLRQAVVAAEDSRFYEHGGVDLKGILRAVVANGASGEVEQGASTLTMQYVRNVLKNDPTLTDEERAAATQVTAGRKINEARYAITLETRLTKDQILERYLNIAYFGHGAYGVYAAAHTYFSKDPSKLTLDEASLLAGLLQSPESDNPIDGDTSRALTRRSYVLQAMVGLGEITADQAKTATDAELKLTPGASPNDCTAAKASTGYFCDYFRSWWQSQAAFGETAADRLQALKTGGYRIVTSLDAKVQATAQAQVLTVYGYTNKRVAPMAVVQPGTGKVLALAVNRHYSAAAGAGNTMNQLVAGNGTSLPGYQAGSTFKMFTMLAALEAGKTLDTGYYSPNQYKSQYADSGPNSCDGYWCPENAAASMAGYRNMWTGFGRSVNTYFVQLEEAVGADKAVEMAERLGIRFRSKENQQNAQDASSWGAFTLGTSLTTPLDLANAYATVAAEGKYCSPTPISSIVDADGKAIAAGQPDCKQVISAEVARAATDAARCPVGQQSAYHRCNGATASSVAGIVGSRDVAGKTGSSDGNVTESFVAYTPQMAIASIAANPTTSKDAVGAAVQRDVIQAVARTLNTSLKGVAEKKFTAPKLTSAFASGFEPREEPSPTQSESTGRNNGNDNGGRKNRNTTPTPSTSPTSGLGGIFGGWGN